MDIIHAYFGSQSDFAAPGHVARSECQEAGGGCHASVTTGTFWQTERERARLVRHGVAMLLWSAIHDWQTVLSPQTVLRAETLTLAEIFYIKDKLES